MTAPAIVYNEIAASQATDAVKQEAESFFGHVWGSNPANRAVDVSYDGVYLHLDVLGASFYINTSFEQTNTWPEPPSGAYHSANILAAQELLFDHGALGLRSSEVMDRAFSGSGVGYGANITNVFGGEDTTVYGATVTSSTLIGRL
jgi:hypothetical protein